MKQFPPLRFLRKYILNSTIRWVFFLGLTLVIILWVALVLVSYFSPDNEQGGTENSMPLVEELTLAEKYPEASAFIDQYFDQIQRGNYNQLVENYWMDEVSQQILSECADPLEQDKQDGFTLWRHCGYFRDISVNVISIDKVENGYQAVIQFTDPQGGVIGLENHPEWVRGHQLDIRNTPAGLKTADWQFITI